MYTNILQQNPLVDFYWAGFRGDTHSLAQNGWDISAEQDPMRMQVRFALRHKDMGIYGYSEGVNWEMQDRFLQNQRMELRTNLRIAKDIVIQHHGTSNMWEQYNPVDTTPTYIEMRRESLRELGLFRKIHVPQEREIIIPEKNIDDLLSEILGKQAPKQAKIRERMNKEEYLKNRNLEAQIISFAS